MDWNFFSPKHFGLGEGGRRQRLTAVHPTSPPRTFRRRGHEGAAAPHAPTSLGRRAADLESSLERFTAPRLGAFSKGVVWARELGRGRPRSPPHTSPRARISRANMVELSHRDDAAASCAVAVAENTTARAVDLRSPNEYPTLAGDDKGCGLRERDARHSGIQISLDGVGAVIPARVKKTFGKASESARAAEEGAAPSSGSSGSKVLLSEVRPHLPRASSTRTPHRSPTPPSHLAGHRHRLPRGHVRCDGPQRRGQDHPPRHHQQAQDRGQGSRQGEKTHSCAPRRRGFFSPSNRVRTPRLTDDISR